jgi:hypothetical protein
VRLEILLTQNIFSPQEAADIEVARDPETGRSVRLGSGGYGEVSCQSGAGKAPGQPLGSG